MISKLKRTNDPSNFQTKYSWNCVMKHSTETANTSQQRRLQTQREKMLTAAGNNSSLTFYSYNIICLQSITSQPNFHFSAATKLALQQWRHSTMKISEDQWQIFMGHHLHTSLEILNQLNWSPNCTMCNNLNWRVIICRSPIIPLIGIQWACQKADSHHESSQKHKQTSRVRMTASFPLFLLMNE